MLDTASKIASWAGLRFNHRKCATLNIDGRKREVFPTQFRIQEGVPAILDEMEVNKHLSVPTGYHVTQSADRALREMTTKLQKIGDSLLAPWQKLDAINTFILPYISFHLKNGVVEKNR